MKVLLDTNVLIAAFISHGSCAELFEHCVATHEVCVCEFILLEFREKLHKKFHFSRADVEEAGRLLAGRLLCVQVPEQVEQVCRDPDDDVVLAAAVIGGCDLLITGDKDLLTLRTHRGIRIVSPMEFWRLELP